MATRRPAAGSRHVLRGPKPGDQNFAASHSHVSPVNVAQVQPTLTVPSLASYVPAGGQASVTAMLTSALSSTNVPAPTGSIQFFDSLSGAAAQAIGTAQGIATGNGGSLLATLVLNLPSGSNVITAVYSGDTNWKTTTSAPTASIVVTTPSFTDAATPNPLTVTAGETAPISVSTQSILGFSAPMALTCGGTLPVGFTCNSATVAPGASGTLTLTTTAPGNGCICGNLPDLHPQQTPILSTLHHPSGVGDRGWFRRLRWYHYQTHSVDDQFLGQQSCIGIERDPPGNSCIRQQRQGSGDVLRRQHGARQPRNTDQWSCITLNVHTQRRHPRDYC